MASFEHHGFLYSLPPASASEAAAAEDPGRQAVGFECLAETYVRAFVLDRTPFECVSAAASSFVGDESQQQVFLVRATLAKFSSHPDLLRVLVSTNKVEPREFCVLLPSLSSAGARALCLVRGMLGGWVPEGCRVSRSPAFSAAGAPDLSGLPDEVRQRVIVTAARVAGRPPVVVLLLDEEPYLSVLVNHLGSVVAEYEDETDPACVPDTFVEFARRLFEAYGFLPHPGRGPLAHVIRKGGSHACPAESDLED